jgi:hypothetical protein
MGHPFGIFDGGLGDEADFLDHNNLLDPEK